MLLKELMKEAGFSQYRLAVESGVPHATLSGLLTGKTKIERCESGTLYKLTKTLGVSMEILVEDGIGKLIKIAIRLAVLRISCYNKLQLCR